jgi:transcriptional regulator with XRE-family HTH domain
MVQTDHHRRFTELGNYLTKLVGNKLRNKQIADALGVSEAAVSQWFSGHKHPEQEHLLNLCGLLHAKFEDIENAFALAGYYLSPEEIEQVNAWQPSDQVIHELQTFNDLTLSLSAVRGLKSGTTLQLGLQFAQSLVRRIRQLIDEERAKTRLLILYFDALDELTQFNNLVIPKKNLKYADIPSYLEMRCICEDTKDQRLYVRLLASEGDEDYVLGRYRASYRKLKALIDSTLVEPEIYIRPILRSSCLDLSDPNVGSDTNFQHVAAQLEAAIDTYSNTINPMVIVLGLEGLSRAYATRYEHTKKLDYKKKALQALEEAEKLAKNEISYPAFGLHVPKAKLRLARSGVLEGLTLTDQASLARDVRRVASYIGHSRSTKDMDDFLREIES